MSLSDEERERLIAAALEVQRRAYAPYSNFHVGAAILTDRGDVFTGANVENASYGLTNCAERVAAGWAMTSVAGGPSADSSLRGQRPQWRAIAIASRGGVTPCGACRQVLVEFAPEMEVLLVDSETLSRRTIAKLSDLLPGYFKLADLG